MSKTVTSSFDIKLKWNLEVVDPPLEKRSFLILPWISVITCSQITFPTQLLTETIITTVIHSDQVGNEPKQVPVFVKVRAILGIINNSRGQRNGSTYLEMEWSNDMLSLNNTKFSNKVLMIPRGRFKWSYQRVCKQF